MRRAAIQSSESAWLIICDICCGMALEATEMRPAPPRAMVARASVSSPEKTRKARSLGEQLGDLHDVAAGFLDADDVGNLGEAEDGGGLEIDAGAAGDVVEQDGQVRGFRDGAEVLELAFLAGLVVVRVGGEEAVEAVDAWRAF
jgi:hypothetical protein